VLDLWVFCCGFVCCGIGANSGHWTLWDPLRGSRVDSAVGKSNPAPSPARREQIVRPLARHHDNLIGATLIAFEQSPCRRGADGFISRARVDLVGPERAREGQVGTSPRKTPAGYGYTVRFGLLREAGAAEPRHWIARTGVHSAALCFDTTHAALGCSTGARHWPRTLWLMNPPDPLKGKVRAAGSRFAGYTVSSQALR